jgi:hypothetical protein
MTPKQPKTRKRPPAKPRYSREQIVGGFSILKILGRKEFPGGVERKDTCWLYLTICRRCGNRLELSQVRLREHERTEKTCCPVCLEQAKKNATLRNTSGRYTLERESEHIQRVNRYMALWPVPPSVRGAQR